MEVALGHRAMVKLSFNTIFQVGIAGNIELEPLGQRLWFTVDDSLTP